MEWKGDGGSEKNEGFVQTQRALGKKSERAHEECESEQRIKEGGARCKGGRTGDRGGGTDFSLGGRVSETMTQRDGPKLGGSGGKPPQEFFLNIDAIRSILGQIWYYVHPTHMWAIVTNGDLAKPGQE